MFAVHFCFQDVLAPDDGHIPKVLNLGAGKFEADQLSFVRLKIRRRCQHLCLMFPFLLPALITMVSGGTSRFRAVVSFTNQERQALSPYSEQVRVLIKSILNRHAASFEQTVLCDFIVDGHFGRHLRRMLEVYAERHAALMQAAQSKLTGLLELSPVEAGLQTVGWLREGIKGEAAVRAAAARNVDLTSLSEFSRNPLIREGIQMGFAAINPQEIKRGVHQLGIALEKLSQRPL